MNIVSIINNQEYINVDDMIVLEDRFNFILAVWKDIILKNSDKKIFELKDNQINALMEYSNQFKIKLTKSTSVSKLDSNIVKNLLLIATKLKRTSTIDYIFKRTKSAAKAMPQYFYPINIINAYINLLEIDKAINVLEFVYLINHKSYWYKLIDINIDEYSNYPEFYKKLKEIRYKSIANLLKSGEIINQDIDLQFIKNIYQYI